MYKYIRQLTQESLIYGVAGVVSRFISFLLVPIYTRLFTPEDYGVMGLIGTITGLIQIFIVLGLDSAAPRWYYDTEEEIERKRAIATWVWCQLGISILLSLVLVFSGRWLGQAIVRRDDAYLYFQISALSLPLTVLSSVIISWFRLKRMAWPTTLFTIVTNLIMVSAAILFVAVLRIGLKGVFFAQLLSAGMGTLLAAFYMKDWISPQYFSSSLLKSMLKYSFPLIPASLAWWVVNLSGQLFIQAYDTTSEVGLYRFGSTIAGILVVITTAFQFAWGPFSISIFKKVEARQVYARVFILYVYATAFLGSAVTLFTPEFIRIFATSSYEGAAPVVGILSFSSIFVGIYYIFSIGPTIVKNMRPVGLATIFAAVVNIGMNFLLVPMLGKTGSAISTLASQVCVCIYVYIYSQKMYPLPYRVGTALLIYGFTFALIFLAQQVQPAGLAVKLALKTALLVLFIPGLFVFKIASFTEIKSLVGSINIKHKSERQI